MSDLKPTPIPDDVLRWCERVYAEAQAEWDRLTRMEFPPPDRGSSAAMREFRDVVHARMGARRLAEEE